MTAGAAPIPVRSIAIGDIIAGDCREAMPAHGPFDMILANPPCGDTSLAWNLRVEGWLPLAQGPLRSTGSLWVTEKARGRIAAVLPLGGGAPS